MNSKDLLTIGQVAARSGVATSALRFYESRGLINSQRTEGNQRRFHRSTLRTVAVIKGAQAVGIPLARIEEALTALPRGRAPTKRDWARLSKVWRDDLDRRISELLGLRDRLANCIGCGCLSLDVCQLYNKGDGAAKQGAGAHYLAQNPAGDGEGGA